jgi:hypothetical protein
LLPWRRLTLTNSQKLHHLATQQDNRLNQHIGNVTTQVALQTQRDSASMFTLAVVTTIFLPPTFVAGVFGTPFFNADDSNDATLRTSRSVWVYPAVAVPLTIVVLAVWSFWFQRRMKRDRSAIELTQSQVEGQQAGHLGDAGQSLREMEAYRVARSGQGEKVVSSSDIV